MEPNNIENFNNDDLTLHKELGYVKGKVDQLEKKMDKIEVKQDSIEGKLDQLSTDLSTSKYLMHILKSAGLGLSFFVMLQLDIFIKFAKSWFS